MSTREPDTIDTAARIACEAHSRGELSNDALVSTLEKLIDLRALENGYAERYGLPSEQGAPPSRISLRAMRARRATLRLNAEDAMLVDVALEIAGAALEYRDVAPNNEAAAIVRLWQALEHVEP